MAEGASSGVLGRVTTPINQEFFIEEIGGGQNPYSVISKFFPEELYSQGLETNLAALLYALVGPVGIGSLRQNWLLARLQVEAAGLETFSLDEFYSNPFELARKVQESYQYIPQGLLSVEEWQHIQAADARFRNRAKNFLKATKAGCTLPGIELAAESGLGCPAEVVENYRYLYDQFTDQPLGLEYVGRTESTEEAIVIAHQNMPETCVQEIVSFGSPCKGSFEVRFPYGNHSEEKRKIEFGKESGAIEESGTFKLINSFMMQHELEKLKSIGYGNIVVKGGPLPLNPLVLYFSGTLSGIELPKLEIVESKIKNLESTTCGLTVNTIQNGSGDGEEPFGIGPEDYYAANEAINQLKSVTTFVDFRPDIGISKIQPIQASFADSTFIEVVRYVTGEQDTLWPTENPELWIRSGIEIPAPVTKDGRSSHYINFHNVASSMAYNEKALEDAAYETANWPEYQKKYDSTRIGEFSKYEVALYPYLSNFEKSNIAFYSQFAIAEPPNLLTMSQTNEEGEGLVEGIYPQAYANYPGVEHGPEGVGDDGPNFNLYFWASRAATTGSDYLEIDLGLPQAINTIYFEITNKPFEVSVAYDLLDNGPARTFEKATISSSNFNRSDTSIGYSGTAPAWRQCHIKVSDSLNQYIYTRYLRLKFERQTNTTFLLGNGAEIPYGVELMGLRVGRSI